MAKVMGYRKLQFSSKTPTPQLHHNIHVFGVFTLSIHQCYFLGIGCINLEWTKNCFGRFFFMFSFCLYVQSPFVFVSRPRLCYKGSHVQLLCVSCKERYGKPNAVYSRQGLTRTIGLINILIDGGQPRAKPHLRRAKPHHIKKKHFQSSVGHHVSSRWLTQEGTLDLN